MELGKKTWVFADGDLPPHGDVEPLGHEALMVANNCGEDAKITLTILFEDKEPKDGIHLTVPAKRVNCFQDGLPGGRGEVPDSFRAVRCDSRKQCAGGVPLWPVGQETRYGVLSDRRLLGVM